MAESFCANAISNAEGWKGVNLPTGGALRVTLEDLDRRVRHLEARERITPPPPMLEATWDSLTWRVCRLARRTGVRPLKRMVPPHITPSMSLLKSIIASINAPVPMVWPEKEDLEEKEVLSLASQWLCHVAGQRNYGVNNLTFELESLCRMALDFSLEAEVGMGPGMHMPGRGGMGVGVGHGVPPGVRPFSTVPTGPKARCCGCCVCSCHNKSKSKLKRFSSVSSDGSRRSTRPAAKSRFCGWFKKLAFWRRKKNDDDDDDDDDDGRSSSSLGSDTIAD